MKVARIASFGLLGFIGLYPRIPRDSTLAPLPRQVPALTTSRMSDEDVWVAPKVRSNGSSRRNTGAAACAWRKCPIGNLRVLLPSEVLFAYDSADISRDFAPTLREVARIMFRRPRLQANVVGHTDSNGSDSYNLDLSLRRAESVAAILSSEGVEHSRLHTEGRGKREPIASNATPEGQRLNRRVEIILYRQRGDRPRRNQPVR
jgi:outer membrane protein OmpA-like peptidoglycan-associated protein